LQYQKVFVQNVCDIYVAIKILISRKKNAIKPRVNGAIHTKWRNTHKTDPLKHFTFDRGYNPSQQLTADTAQCRHRTVSLPVAKRQ
jgi:hypothetical protein